MRCQEIHKFRKLVNIIRHMRGSTFQYRDGMFLGICSKIMTELALKTMVESG